MEHSDSYYYTVRSFRPESLAEKAARFIYLNRTCFNGIYRVNRNGQFNVPRGTRNSVIFKTDDFEGVSKLLKNAELKACDFEEVIDGASAGDLVFADPPYTIRHNNNAFIKYNEDLFSWDDQIRLASCLKRAAQRGALIIATNAYHQSVVELYRNYFQLQPIYRKSMISADKKFRGKYEELLIMGNLEHAESYDCVFRRGRIPQRPYGRPH
ncbi:MAG: adenine methylase [Desulfomicrobiaceae bacterium]|jgi:DNA adenine methylase|nr:adenine methylase [Desulfomicrobiaceae bacterium]